MDESIGVQIAEIEKNILGVFDRRRVALIALCFRYAGVALREFRARQSAREFWNNQTGTAYAQVFAREIVAKDFVGFFLSHAVEYGIYLELANNRKHEALRPIIFGLEKDFIEDVRKLME